LMVEIINYIATTDANIINVNTKQSKDQALLIKLGLNVFTSDQLEKVMVGIRNNPNVDLVERMFK
jgi:(p)ppGpp synthase/HD superfamily hydrolase